MNFISVKKAICILPTVLFFSLYSETPWYFGKEEPAANFFDLKAAHDAGAEQREEPRIEELTRMLRQGAYYWELIEGDVQFKRWSNFVEPRVADHMGDLSVFAISQAEKLRLYPLQGPVPALRYGNWISLGPKNTDWLASPGSAKNKSVGHQAGAGRINSITFHPTDVKKMMVGTPSGGLWFTGDGGVTWNTTTDLLPTLGATWAVYHPTNPDVIYLGTGESNSSGGDAPSVGLLKSLDGGGTWNTTGLSFEILDQTQISKVEIDLQNPDKILVGTTDGLYISENAGVTFDQINLGGGTVWDIEIHPTNRDIIYVSTTRFYRSTNGGGSFTEVTDVPRNGNRTYIGISRDTPGIVYALNSEAQSFTGIYRSSNSGQSFTRMGSGAAANCTQAWYDVSFAVSNTDPDELVVGCRNVYMSTDGGASLDQISTDVHVDQHNAHYRPGDNTLFVANDGGIYRYGGEAYSWTDLNADLSIRQLYRMGVHPDDYDQLCAGSQDNGTDLQVSMTSGFRRIITNDGFECFWNTTGTRLYGEEPNGVVYGCDYTDGVGEQNCTELNVGESGNWDTDLAPHPSDPNTLYAGMRTNVWRSTNSGSNWSRLGNIGGTGTIRNFAIAPSDPDYIYVMKGSNVFRTSNSGSSWSDVWPGGQGTPIYAAVDGSDPEDVWVVVSGYTEDNKVFHTTDAGGSWTNETRSGLPNLPVNTVVIDNLESNQPGIYIGMDAGVYYRNSTHSSWQNFSDGIPNVIVTELEIGRKGSDDNRRLLASTYGRGIWRTPLWEDALGTDPRHVIPEIMQFGYSRVPGSRQITVQVILAKEFSRPFSLYLVNSKGQRVFEKKLQHARRLGETIDISLFSNGVYFINLKMDGQVITRAVALH